MSAPLPLRFVASTTNPVTLICEGTVRPKLGERVRASGSEGNGLLVVEVVEPEQLPISADLDDQRFGIKLKYNEIPWPPDTRIEVVTGNS